SIEEGSGLLLQTRPAIGGNIMATIKTAHHRPQMATVRPHSMQPLPPDFGRRGSIIHVIDDSSLGKIISDSLALSVQVLALESNVKDFENLESAQIVVSGGRGLKKADNFKLIRELALALGGAVGASRESVDRGWISYPHQVGLSGKTISPEIYICAGISGAVQHLAGIRTAKKIISINIDPDAPIHAVADLAIIGDLFEILPRLTAQLKSIYSSSSGSESKPEPRLDPGFSPGSVLRPGSVSSLGHGSSSPPSSLSPCQTKDTKLQEPDLPRSEILSKEAQHEI
ncbi:MAG TPA: electron transfer flavoprotein subunit alpha/FixB family protein, partial [Rectinema sp.]|nr:electron transfer flavoprotein subunit alpha/FixB family protein [Rectinema sp.]